jgi:outer membrane protein assembly factor BamB
VPAVKLGADWPVPGGTPDNRRCAGNELAPPLALAWHTQLGGTCSQPILAGGRLFLTVTTRDYEENNAVVCLDPADGKVLWRAPLEGSPRGPAAFDSGVVATVDRHDRAYGFNAADGKPLWKTEGIPTFNGGSGQIGSVTAASGVFYVGSLYALEAGTGRKLWKGGAACTREAALGGGKLITNHGCLDVKTGAWVWGPKVKGWPSQAALVLDDNVFVAGQLLKLADGAAMPSFPGVDIGGQASSDGRTLLWAGGSLKAFSLAEGKPLWDFSPYKWASFSPVTMTGRYTYFAAGDGLVRAVTLADGKEAWHFRLGSWASAPTISGNALFFAGEDGCAYALTGAATGAPPR